MSSSRRSFLAASLSAPALLAAPAAKGDVKLSYRTLGKTGMKVTAVSFGAMITSDGTVLERAADAGINYFDTARGYQNGNCERMVGNALKSRRKNVFISTKSPSRTKAGALADLDTSLRELQTDYVDIWYLHAIGKPEEITDELIEAQAIAKQAGKIRFSGFSTHGGHKDVIPKWVAAKKFDVLLSSYNFTMDASMEGLLKQASDSGMGVVAMKVMAGGARRADAKMKELLKREGSQLAMLKWVLRNQSVHTTIPSITDNEQLEDNLKAMSVPFVPADGKILEARLREMAPEYCRMCGSCSDQCRYGLPVADVNRYLMYAENYGEFGLGRDHFQMLPASLKEVRCGSCEGCTVQCPNGVRVSGRMARAQESFA